MPLNVMVGGKSRRLHAGNLVSFEIKDSALFGGFMARIDGCEPSLIFGLGNHGDTVPTDPNGKR